MLLDLLKERTSVRNFSSKKVPNEIINHIIEAGRLSPSGGNEQAWKFGVITDKKLINDIALASYNQNWITSSSLLVVLCTCIVDVEKGGRDIQKARFPELAECIMGMDEKLYNALNLEEHQTKIPGTHMVLSALEHGVASTWVSYFMVKKVAELLKLPEACIPSEIIAFGYPKEKRMPVKKKSVDEIVFYNTLT